MWVHECGGNQVDYQCVMNFGVFRVGPCVYRISVSGRTSSKGGPGVRGCRQEQEGWGEDSGCECVCYWDEGICMKMNNCMNGMGVFGCLRFAC